MINVEIQAVIYAFRKAVFLKNDPTETFRRYYDLTGDMSHTHLIPYTPEEAAKSVAKTNENVRVMMAVAACRRTLEGVLAEKPRDTLKGYLEPQVSFGVADYSGGAIQGKYMGHKPAVRGMAGKATRARSVV